MEVIEGLEQLKPMPMPHGVCVGGFDGFHVGHQYLLSKLCGMSWERGLRSCMITFEPIPAQYFAGPDAPPLRLTTHDERIELASMLCCNLMVILEMNKALVKTNARDFCQHVLVDRLHTRLLLASANHTIGVDRAGIDKLTELGQELGFEVAALPILQTGEIRVSSTQIRNFLTEGHVEEAAGLLGRHYSLYGTVVTGRGKGREMGFPTVNLQVPDEKVLPADAVYAGVAVIESDEASHQRRVFPAAISIGTAPTFQLHQHLVEAYLLSDEPLDLLGRTVKLEFVRRLRWQHKFAGEDELKQQIGTDVDQTLRLCHGLVAEGIDYGPAQGLCELTFEAGTAPEVSRQPTDQ